MDITYIPIVHGFVWLAAVVDCATRRVLSWRASIRMTTDFCLDALDEALTFNGRPQIFNTDQGSQFTSRAFTQPLRSNGIAVSMDGKGSWRDNVFVERLWRSGNYEEVCLHAYESVSQAREGLARYFDFYNRRKPHSKLHRLTPDQVYFDSLPLPMTASTNGRDSSTFTPQGQSPTVAAGAFFEPLAYNHDLVTNTFTDSVMRLDDHQRDTLLREVSTEVLPGAPTQLPVADPVVAPTLPSAAFAYIPVNDQLAVINELPLARAVTWSAGCRQLLADILKAISAPREPADFSPMVFTWPLSDAGDMPVDSERARLMLEGFLSRRLKLRPVRYLLVLAEQSAGFIFPAQASWQTLQPLKKALDQARQAGGGEQV